MIIDIIAGARPNFIKIAPIIKAIEQSAQDGKNISYRLVHTGQHYDKNMSGSFFEELEIPTPTVNFDAGSGTQAEQTGAIMFGYEKLLLNKKSDLCLVVGDVTSTMACAIVARKTQIPVAHVEAGIRSNDWSMPEEINRIVTDSITNYFFTTTISASNNLRKQGVSSKQIHFVGNVMIDTLNRLRGQFIQPQIWRDAALTKQNYILLTLHRPANVDQEFLLRDYINEILKSSNGLPVIFPVHPRTSKILKKLNIVSPQLYITEPLSYLEFNYLAENAKVVITDSGGITEETTVMKVPCITLRNNTERPETVEIGTNELIGTNPNKLKGYLDKVFKNKWKEGSIPEKWDGNAARRIVDILLKIKYN
tara:strand:+ start:41561 stop:42655 length:1095 start_codon:yes stop_codon:yes gene_type:complete